jgi:hypothetical protein
MRPIRIAAFAGLLLLGWGLVPGCRAERREPDNSDQEPSAEWIDKLTAGWEEAAQLDREHFTYLSVFDKPVQADCYVTWLAYNTLSGPMWEKAALFVWNGEPVGRGDEGLAEVLRRMAKANQGIRILIYPYIKTPPWSAISAEDNSWTMPIWLQELRPVAVERNLHIVFSPFDHTGQLHPPDLAALAFSMGFA